MSFESGEVPRFGDNTEAYQRADHSSFQATNPEYTGLAPTSENALDHTPRQFDPSAAENSGEVAAHPTALPLLKGGLRFIDIGTEDLITPGFEEYYLQQLKEKYARKLDGESPPNKRQTAILRQADAGIDTIGELANIAIPPAMSPVRMFNQRADYDEAYRGTHNEDCSPENTQGTYVPELGILWSATTASGDIGEFSGLVHERVHQRSSYALNIALTAIIDGQEHVGIYLRGGFELTLGQGDAYWSAARSASNEAATEMAALRIGKSMNHDMVGTYVGISLLLGGIISKVADKLHVGEQDVEFAVYRDMFGGAHEAEAMIYDVLGPKHTALFSAAGNASLRETELIAGALGLRDAETRAKELATRAEQGKPLSVDLFGWQPVGKSPQS